LAGASGIEICRRRTDVVDAVLRALFESFGDSGVALAALGGYGRREMAPGSDIDLLFVHGGLPEQRLRPVVDAVLYPLWDAGMQVSHAVRTPDECRTEAEARLESLTTVLGLRELAGMSGLSFSAHDAVLSLARAGRSGLMNRLIEWRGDRARRFGYVGAMLEPDLKESLGALRDLSVLTWCLSIEGSTATVADLDEFPRLVAALDDLLLFRTALHRMTGSRSDRLVAEHHQGMADQLGLLDEPGWEPRDALMRRISLNGRHVDGAVDAVLERIQRAAPGFTGPWVVLNPIRRRGPPARPWKKRWRLGSLAGFLELLSLSGKSRSEPLELDESGYWEGAIPGWSAVRGRPQRDPYHRYPVDVHLWETLGEIHRLLDDQDAPFSQQAVRDIGDPSALLLGGLFHDIGKVGRGSHVPIGVEVAAAALDHMLVEGELRDDVLFMVREHLLLADTATRRNLDDEDLILGVAARIGDPRRLALLYLLTVADARATGPSASTPWRLNLIRDLVAKVSHAFDRGLMDQGLARRLEEARSDVSRALLAAGIAAGPADGFLSVAPPGYLLWVDPKRAPSHHALIEPRPRVGEVRIHVASGRSPATREVSVGAVDEPGLLASIAGSFTLSGFAILSARAFTTSAGLALDVFEVRGAFDGDIDIQRWSRFESILQRAVARGMDMDEEVRSVRSRYRLWLTDVPVTVTIDHDASDVFTVIEVAAPDGLGLLFGLSKVFSEQGLDVHLAKAATYGPRVIDVFYVQDEEGQKITDRAQLERLEQALVAAASS
jgi:[protein-PII] uridylyltransferase